jgi:hypothetical protein
MAAPVSSPADPLLDRAVALLDELRVRCAAADPGADAEELLVGGYAAAHALEGACRRLRAEALERSERELRLAARERELRALLRTLRGRLAGRPAGAPGTAPAAGRSDDEPAAQRLH